MQLLEERSENCQPVQLLEEQSVKMTTEFENCQPVQLLEEPDTCSRKGGIHCTVT